MSDTPNPQPAGQKRRNVYFRNPQIFEAFQMAISKGIIKARGASERIEELIAADIRRHAPKFRKAKLIVPEAALTK